MKLIFAGTPEFAAVALKALLDDGFDVALVLTQPDRPAGRGLKLQPSAVKQLAIQHDIPVAQPLSLRLEGKHLTNATVAQALMQQTKADAMVVAAYGLILPQWALDLPRLGCLNIHASLLPRWRGAAPIHRAIEAGDAETGVTIMQMDAGLDTGDMLLEEAIPIQAFDTTQSLHDKLASMGGQMVVRALRNYGELTPRSQPESGITYATKISKLESAIDLTKSAQIIERKIRALNPAPGCTIELNGEPLKVWRAQLEPTPLGIPLKTGDGVLYLTELQRAGGKRVRAADYLRGTHHH